MPTIVVSGATGFVGPHLVEKLTLEGNNVVVISRDEKKVRDRFGPSQKHILWDFKTPLNELSECDVVVHLAGESLFGKRWNDERRKNIRASRVDSTRLLVKAMSELSKKPHTFVCGSAIGYYGDRGDETLDENSPPGSDFLANVCVEWEAAAKDAEKLGIRVVSLRTGIVLGNDGGALAQLLQPFKLGVGGPVGSGKQFMSWIHLEDAVGLVSHSMKYAEVRGAINLTSPNPVTNREFSQQLGKVMGKPSAVTTPAFALKLVLGEVADVVLASDRVLPSVATKTHYSFKFPGLEPALRDLL